MDYLKIISDLCAVIGGMSKIVREQAEELAQLGAVSHEEEIAAVRQKYAQAMGEEVEA